MKAKLVRLTVVALVLGSVAHAFNEPDGFKGLKWGMSPDEAIKVIQEQTPGPISGGTQFGSQVFYEDWIASAETKIMLQFSNYTLGELHPLRLDEIFIKFRATDFTIIQEVFIKRYGKPTLVRTEQLQNLMGVKFQSHVLYWRGKRRSIMLMERVTIDAGAAQFAPAQELEKQLKNRRKSIEEAVKNL